MPTYREADIMDALIDGTPQGEPYGAYFFTASGTIKMNHSLVMGKGFAKRVADAFPKLPRAAGQLIELVGELLYEPKSRRYRGIHLYGILPPRKYLDIDHEGGWMPKDSPAQIWCPFQTKFAFWDPSSLPLIELSVHKLQEFAKRNRKRFIALNYPGIGLGELTRAAVEPLLAPLPSYVHIFSLDQEDT